MTPTPQRIQANRVNAQFSTGPKSESGKIRSSQNAKTHGLFAVRRASEELSAFTAPIIADLAPASFLERQLAESIAHDHFRLNRIREIESRIFLPVIGSPRSQADAFLEHSKELERLTLYETRINRLIQRNMAQLKSLQSERRAEHARQMEEARLLSQFSLFEGKPYHPALDGFVFSNAEINTAIDRNHRLQHAQMANKTAKRAANHG